MRKPKLMFLSIVQERRNVKKIGGGPETESAGGQFSHCNIAINRLDGEHGSTPAYRVRRCLVPPHLPRRQA
jgi:hypothetical protein